jgi:hypothetical protein
VAAEVAVAGRPEAEAGEGELGPLAGVGRVVDGVLHFVLVLCPPVLPARLLGGQQNDPEK